MSKAKAPEVLVEAVARCMALIEPGDDWPTNEALGGNLTGTRDDEYRHAMREQAADVLDGPLAGLLADAALLARGGQHDHMSWLNYQPSEHCATCRMQALLGVEGPQS